MKQSNELTPNEPHEWTTKIVHSLEPFDDSEEITEYYLAYPDDDRRRTVVLSTWKMKTFDFDNPPAEYIPNSTTQFTVNDADISE